MKKTYKQFSKFIQIVAVKELRSLILDAKYAKEFSIRVKALLKEIEKEGKRGIEISVLFDTDGNVAVIDGTIIGKYIAGCYNITISKYYKEESLNKLVDDVISGTEKVKDDFIHISYAVMYNVIGGLYSEIKCNKELLESYKANYGLIELNSKDEIIIVLALILVEDICRYIDVNSESLNKCIKNIKNKNNITN